MRISLLDSRRTLAIAALVVAAIFFVAINALSNALFRGATIDFTEDKVFTLSPGTLKVLSNMDEPITLRFYYSPRLGKEVPQYGIYAARVREMLERYRSLSRGRIRLEVYNPEPFSDAEDRANGYGLRSVPINRAGEQVFFGLIATNSVDDEEKIAFFHPSRAAFIEYDLTRMIMSLAQPRRKVVGIVTNLPINGRFLGPGRFQPAWPMIDEIRSIFETKTISAGAKEIPKNVDVLLIIHPRDLKKDLLYAIDQYVLKGGKALVFVDANPEVDRSRRPIFGIAPVGPPSDMPTLFKSWGIERVADKVAADFSLAVRVNVGVRGSVKITDYVAWMQLGKANIDRADPVTAGLSQVIVATSGFLRKLPKATTRVKPLLWTTAQAQAITSSKVRFSPDVEKLLGEYQPGTERLVLAARISGKVKSAFPKGRPVAPKKKADPKKKKTGKADPKKDKADKAKTDKAKTDKTKKAKAKKPAKHLAESKGSIDVIVVADVDMMQDQFWRRQQNFYGARISLPSSGNADFVINALDNLSGANALIGLRGRGQTARPFTLVKRLQDKAATRLRAKEKELTKELKDTQEKLKDLRTRRDKDGEIILTKQQVAAILDFRTKLISIRRQLRGVQLALRRDIDALDTYLKLINIGLVPFFIALAAIFIGIVRRRWRRRGAA